MAAPLELSSSIATSDQLSSYFQGGAVSTGVKNFGASDWKKPAAVAAVLLLALLLYRKVK